MRSPKLCELPKPPADKQGWPWTEDGLQLPETMSDGSKWPRVSIVTAVYNHGQYLEEAIRSVLLQGYPNIEYIIINDGSTDNTEEVISKYSQWLAYSVTRPNRGFCNSLNEAFGYCSGEIFGWMNADDFYKKNAIQTLVELRKKNSNAVAWTGGTEKIDLNYNRMVVAKPRISQPTPKEFARVGRGAVVYQPSTLFDATLFKRIGGIDKAIDTAVDIDLWVSLAEYGVFVATDDVLSTIRMYPEAKHLRDKAEVITEVIYISNKHGFKDVAKEWLQRYVENPGHPY